MDFRKCSACGAPPKAPPVPWVGMPATSLPIRRRELRGALATLALAVLLGGCSSQSARTTSTSPLAEAPSASGFDGAALPPNIPAPGFTLTDRLGRRVSLGSYRGRVTLLAFLYSTCGPTCDLIAQQIRGALDELQHPPAVLILSADPAADTPASVARFLARASLGGRVEYLSGSPSHLARVLRSFRVTAASLSRRAFERSTAVLLLDRGGEERVLFQSEQLTPEALAHDIGKLESG
jgi:protein SCO1/2